MLLALSRGLLARRCEAPVVRLACIRHAASVNPEPGSNSPKMSQEPRAKSLEHKSSQLRTRDSQLAGPKARGTDGLSSPRTRKKLKSSYSRWGYNPPLIFEKTNFFF